MTTSQVYSHYHIMPNLKLHMYRVTGVGLTILDHWTGPHIDRDLITRTLLLHDMGNIIKFDLSNQPRWLKVKQDFIRKYGPDEYQATLSIARELNQSKSTLYLLAHRNSPNLPQIARSKNWSLKLVSYPDMRVAPTGVVTVNQRFDDLIARYQHKHHLLSDTKLIETSRQACIKVEQQLQTYTSLDLGQISASTIKPYLKSLPDYQITPELYC